MHRLPLLLLLTACDDDIFPTPEGGGAVAGEGYCAVQSIFQGSCLGCHSAAGAAGGLDLETDAHAALVGVASAGSTGRIRVVAGDPEGSLLYVKVTGTQAASEGGTMPPSGELDAATLEVIRAWIADGASGDCGATDTGPPGNYHPAGWAEPGAHGMAAKHQEDTCLTCHGADLDGGDVEVSCNSCHEAGWQTDCTYCHGGIESDEGAPPEDISDNVDPTASSFPVHTTHVLATETKGALDCVQCHTKPTEALSLGHLFVKDATPGVAEVTFGAGLSPVAAWSGTGCSNLYCHGTGQGSDGSVEATDTVACGDCHAVQASGQAGWVGMSGAHAVHLADGGLVCSDCHGEVVTSTGTIAHAEQHVDGRIDVLVPSAVTRAGDSCTGTCHDRAHNALDWR